MSSSDRVADGTHDEVVDAATEAAVARLLGSLDLDVMPAPVWARLESALREESRERQAVAECHPEPVRPELDKDEALPETRPSATTF